jgi:hypothetical protein
MREQSALLVQHRHGALVAGGLNGQDAHDWPAFCLLLAVSLESRPLPRRQGTKSV